MITIEHARHDIGHKTILHDINLTFAARPGITALIGPNGAGKSTLLSLMARLIPLQHGRIRYGDIDISRADSRLVAKTIAIMQQQTRFMSRLTIDDLLTFARYPYHHGRPKDEDRRIIDETLAYFSLSALRHTFIDELSGGQRQRALVAMVFAQNTAYILLDEPLNNLDMHHARNLMTTLRHAADDLGKTIIIVLHDINYAARYADTIIAMQDGRITHSGSPDEVLQAVNIATLYDLDVEMIEHEGRRVCLYF
ncbi:ATP-binding cassette domain-containing protein [uncultured Cardiobacterium sp.]|uniref:iron ABC transporter ATP-binding protein n=1 Tax=uncultured Cardiobacterium sp. TaxID=417619 RepID=UPI002610D14E|nr:ATP-binding cassette domain-containing protein [uncultured Cardiobacterium sp.]